MGNSLLYPSCEHPDKVERYLKNGGNPNIVFLLKREMGPREDWRHKLQTLGSNPSLAMVVADYVTGDDNKQRARVDLLNHLVDLKINLNYATDIGVRLVDVVKAKGDYYPEHLIRRIDPDTYLGATVAIVRGKQQTLL